MFVLSERVEKAAWGHTKKNLASCFCMQKIDAVSLRGSILGWKKKRQKFVKNKQTKNLWTFGK